MATHSSILAWEVPWTEDPVGLQSMGSQRVTHDWSNLACAHTHTHTPCEKAEAAREKPSLLWRLVLWRAELRALRTSYHFLAGGKEDVCTEECFRMVQVVFLKHMVYAVSVWQKHLCLKYSLTVPCHLAKQCGLFRTNLLWLTTESCMCVSEPLPMNRQKDHLGTWHLHIFEQS